MNAQADDPRLGEHLAAINACNQRGGRMLSLPDLIAAGTVDLPLAAYLAAAMRAGASLLVGARPGGAGKTTVMCALLNFLPDETSIRVAESSAVLAHAAGDTAAGKTCYIAHEIGNAALYAYLWGRAAQAFFALAARGHLIAANLHADTPAEAQEQLCGENGVAAAHLNAVRLKLFLRVNAGPGSAARRVVSHVYESDGPRDHLLWRHDPAAGFIRDASHASTLVTPRNEACYHRFLTTLMTQRVHTIDDVRRALIRNHTGIHGQQ